MDADECVQRLLKCVQKFGDSESWIDNVDPFIKVFSGPSLDETLSVIRQGQLLRLKRNAKTDTVGATHSEEARQIFAALSPVLDQIVDSQGYLPSSHPTQATTSVQSLSSKALTFMKLMALLVHAYLDSILTKHTSPVLGVRSVLPQVTRIAEALQDSLLSLSSCGPEGILVQKTIMTLCETYWMSNFADRQILTTQLVPLFFIKSLSLLSNEGGGNRSTNNKALEGSKADLKRIWTFREALQCFDFESISTSKENNNSKENDFPQLDMLILRTVSSPLYCKNVEGRKIIAFCFTLHESIAMKLHHAIKGQIPYLRGTLADKSSLEYYGDMYLRAWKLSHPDLHDVEGDGVKKSGASTQQSSNDLSSIHTFIEEEILSDLISSSLHVASVAIAKNVRFLLEPFFANKKDSHLVSLLYRLYGPILWRSLSAANPNVRYLATTILQKTFPLEDTQSLSRETAKSNKQEVVNRTVNILQQLLTDVYPRIRVAAADATVRILAEFWDAIPPRHIRSLLQIIITKHANDASSSLVRAHALHVMTLLLKSSDASHAVLRQLLPSLGNLIHDKVERVRLKAVQLLSTIKTLKDIKFYHVVPSEHILCQLAVEGKMVSRAITKLLLNSYFPKDAKGSEQMERTLLFLSRNYDAARVFYSNLKYCYPMNVICKLIAMLLKVLKLAVDRHKVMMASGDEDMPSQSLAASTGESDDESEAEKESNDTSTATRSIIATNTSLMASVAETIEILYDSIDSLSTSSESYLQSAVLDVDLASLVDHFGSMSTKYTQSKGHTTETSCCQRITISLLRFYSNLSQDQVNAISTQQLSKILSVDLSAHDASKISAAALPYVILLCLCGHHVEMAKLLSGSIINVVQEVRPFSRGKEARIDGAMDIASDNSFKIFTSPDVALNVLSEIMKGCDPHSRAARVILLTSKDSYELLEGAFESLHIEYPIKSFDMSRIFIMLHEVSLRYRIHKTAGDELIKDLTRLFNTVSNFAPILADMSKPKPATAHDNNGPSSPFQVLNVSNISMDLSTRISLSPASLVSGKYLKRKHSDVENDVFDRVSGIAHGLSLLNLLLAIVCEYKSVGGDVSDQILTQWGKLIEPIYSLDTGDEIPWGKIASTVLYPAFDRVFPSTETPVA